MATPKLCASRCGAHVYYMWNIRIGPEVILKVPLCAACAGRVYRHFTNIMRPQDIARAGSV